MDSSNNPALIVLAWGNLSRGDDAAGPMLAEKIQALNHNRIQLEEDLQLNIEHVMDLKSQIPVLFIDASCKPEQSFYLEKLSADPDQSISTHSVSPKALLHLFEKTHKQNAPEAFMLHISGKEFELGQTVSQHTQSAIDQAWECLKQLFKLPENEWLSSLHASVESKKLP
ncbi:MAG: hydrogenase maturation protease [Gammaproteobacteria bacterium]|nr:hydrogenase maturation protease [Gammaproteobacteria bacterium]